MPNKAYIVPRLRLFYGCISAIGAIAVLGYLYSESNVDSKEYNTTKHMIRDLARLDERLGIETLKAEAKLSNDYDEFGHIFEQVKSLKLQLASKQLDHSVYQVAHFNQQLKGYLALLDTKEQLVESFKTNHAIIQNSERFLLRAIKNVEFFNESLGDKALELEALKIDLFKYITFREDESRAKIQQHLQDLNKHAQLVDNEDVIANVKTLISHIVIILTYRSKVDKSVEKIVKAGIAQASSHLIFFYETIYGMQLKKAEYYRLTLLIYSAVLMLIIALIGYKLKASYRSLNQSNEKLNIVNEQLHELNTSLEDRVNARTQDLKKTVHQLKNSQQQLIQSAKMAAMGQMVSGVAHEINTPLGYVSSNVDVVQDTIENLEDLIQSFFDFSALINTLKIDDDHIVSEINLMNQKLNLVKESDYATQIEELLEDMRFGLGHISEIVVNLQDFSRMDRAAFTKFDIRKGVESALKIAHNNLKNSCEIVKNLQEVPGIDCMPSQINQVILNLINNARDAIDDTLTVDSTRCDRKGQIKISTYSAQNNVCIEVEDNGTGIDLATQKQMFDPFYTTKDVGKGTGLGLSISHKIISDHKGKLKVTSKPGVGTKFTIELPVNCQQKDTLLKVG